MSNYAIKRFIIKTMKLEGYISSYRLRPDLPNYLSQVLIGLLLSDGSLEKPRQEGGVRFSLNLSFNNVSFLLHVYNLFEPFALDGFPNIVKVINKDKEFDSIRFKTVILPNLVNYYDRFYQFRSEKGVSSEYEHIQKTPKIVKVLLALSYNGYNDTNCISIHDNGGRKLP